jgi:hypothetical protein
MRVDTILQQVAELTPAERAELLTKLRERYGSAPAAVEAADEPAPPRPDQTAVYSLDQIINRARRST